ncbi:MAG: phenylacetate--CoA ligase family protein [bacterium]|nr:phenylacetate--CoA ligase family protein [bacterium]
MSQAPSVPAAAPAADPIAALDATVARAAKSPLYATRLAGVRIRALDDLHALPLTTRADLQQAGPHGTRAVPLEAVCHFGESSGTSGGAVNTTWLTADDFARDAATLRARHPDVFAPGRVLLNRFPFMAAPAHLMQLVAQQGGGVAVPAGNINWDVPFPRALELARRTGAHVLAGVPLEPIVLGAVARGQGIDPARDTAVDTLFLGGAALPPALQRRMARTWGARVIELYGSTETMLLGTSCPRATLHLEDGLAFAEVLDPATGTAVPLGGEGHLVVTTLGIDGSPLVRYDTGDLVRALPPCPCGDARPAIQVLGRAAETVVLGDVRLHAHDLVDGAACAADALDSDVFFVVVLRDRILLRVETRGEHGDPMAAWRARVGDVPLEIECVAACDLLDVETLARSPRVYKPAVSADWRGPGRRILTVGEGMIEWPRPSAAEAGRWIARTWRAARRRRALAREQGR